MKTLRFAVPAVVAALALGACAPAEPATDPTPSGGTPVTTPAEPTPSESATPSPVGPTIGIPPAPGKQSPRPGKTVPPGVQTLTGTVTSGVEPGCLLLDDYLLLGGPADVLKSGARVTVTGQAQPDLMTTCQQGTPFVVESAKRS